MSGLKMKCGIPVVLAAVGLGACLAVFAAGQEGANAPMDGSAAPEIALEDLNGKTFKLSELKGRRGVVLVFFATWCPYCARETSALIEFRKKYVGEKLALYGIDIRQPKSIVERFARRHKINYPILLDVRGKAASDYHVEAIPLVLGIDRDGMIRFREHALPRDRQDLERLRDRLMQGANYFVPAEKEGP